MKLLHYLFILILTGTLWACEKPEQQYTSPPQPSVPIIFERTWSGWIDIILNIVSTENTQLFEDWVLVGVDLGDSPSIYAFNKDTGNKDWELILTELDGKAIKNMFIHEHILIARNLYYVFAVDLTSRNLIWEENLKEIDMRVDQGHLAANGKYYQKASKFLYPLGNEFRLYEFDIETGSSRIVYSKPPNNQVIFDCSPPVYLLDNNREILILNEYPDAAAGPDKSTQNLVAIDLNTLEVIWKTEDFTENYYSNSGHPPIVYNDIIITGGDWSIYGFDIHTGEQLWRSPTPGFDRFSIWNNTNHLLHDDRLYVNNSSNNSLCLNPNTGDIIWHEDIYSFECTDNMVYYEKEDYLIFTSSGLGSVIILDGLTGELIHSENKFRNSNYKTDVVYDEERDMFFTCTEKHAIGFKVNKPE